MMHARIASERDVDLIVPMMEAFNRHEAIAWSRASGESALRALIADRALGVVGIVERASTCVGYFVLSWGYDLEWNGRDAFLTELWIEPAFRGNGTGAEALAHAERLAREHEARALHLMVRHENSIARRLYDRAGFTSPPRAFLTKLL